MAAFTSFGQFIEKLDAGLQVTLPGDEAHRVMEALSAQYLGLKPDENTRKSAVLILLYPCGDKICFPLILRQNYVGFHSAEVSFPGGKYEQGDKDLIQTALREANEEIGLEASEVHILGTLTDTFIGTSNFMVRPVVGYVYHKPEFLPNHREVEQIFEVSLDHFMNPRTLGISEILIPGDTVLTPFYRVEGHKVWGATAKIINELLDLTGSNTININK